MRCKSCVTATQAGSASHCGLTFSALTTGVAQFVISVIRAMFTPIASALRAHVGDQFAVLSTSSRVLLPAVVPLHVGERGHEWADGGDPADHTSADLSQSVGELVCSPTQQGEVRVVVLDQRWKPAGVGFRLRLPARWPWPPRAVRRLAW